MDKKTKKIVIVVARGTINVSINDGRFKRVKHAK